MNILIWGTGSQCALYRNLLLSPEFLKHSTMKHDKDTSKYNVLALINNDPNSPKQIDNIPVISKENIHNFKFDYIVVIVLKEHYNEIMKDAAAIGIDRNRLVPIDQFLRQEKIVEPSSEEIKIQCSIIQDILHSDEKDIHSYEWLYNKICEYGIFCYQANWYTYGNHIRWTKYGMLQIPEEFARFCLLLGTLKVHTALEIGVFRGRSSYFMCAVLARMNPDLKYVLVDINDGLDNYDTYQKILPNLEKRIPSCSKDYIGQHFDFVFIDGSHTYQDSIADYYNVGQYSNVLTGFHDIYAHEYDHEGGGTVRTWQEVAEKTQGKEHLIFSTYPEKWMGIGCVMAK